MSCCAFSCDFTLNKKISDSNFQLTSQVEKSRACSSCGLPESSCKTQIPPASLGTGYFLQHQHKAHVKSLWVVLDDKNKKVMQSYSAAGFSQYDLIALLTSLSDAAAQREHHHSLGPSKRKLIIIIMAQALWNSWALTGNVTQREDFPEQDAVGPDVTLEGVDTVEDALRRHPLDWQTSLEWRCIQVRRMYGLYIFIYLLLS